MWTYLGSLNPRLLFRSRPSRLLDSSLSLPLERLLPCHLFRCFSKQAIAVSRTLIGEVCVVRQLLRPVVGKRAEGAKKGHKSE